MARCLVILIAILSLAAAPATTQSTTAPAPIRVTKQQRAEDQVTITQDGDRALIDVVSPRGIGNMSLATGQWPAELVVRLHLRSLEGFTATRGGCRVEGSLRGGLELQRRTPNGAWEPVGKDEPAPTIREVDGAIEIVFPPLLIAPGPAELQVQWIDAYR